VNQSNGETAFLSVAIGETWKDLKVPKNINVREGWGEHFKNVAGFGVRLKD
jgi:hypothetical protein